MQGKEGTRIYGLKVGVHIDANFIRRLRNAKLLLTKEEVLDGMFSVIDHEQEPIKLHSKAQKHLTCGFISPKSALEGILYLLKRESLLKTNISMTAANEAASVFSCLEYKKFTYFMREKCISNLILKMKAHHNDQEFYLKICEEIIVAHHGKNISSSSRSIDKKKQEVNRANKLFVAVNNYNNDDSVCQFYNTIFLKRNVNLSVFMNTCQSLEKTEASRTPRKYF